MKAHSERVPNKNIRLLAGKPLYHYVAEILHQSHFVKEILIDTDSDAIAEEAAKHFPKVRIIKRPVDLCGDFVSMNDIIAYDITQSSSDHFLQTHSTNPLLSDDILNAAIETYFESLETNDSLFTVTAFQSRFYWADGEPINHDPDVLLRTQDLPEIYEENSNLYIFSRQAFAEAGGKRIGKSPRLFPMSKMESVDIDDQDDWHLAEALIKLRTMK